MTTLRRTIELEVVIRATPADIWKALSTAEGISRWFPPIAEGGGALGSEVFISWGQGMEWRTTTTAWEVNRHLQWSDSLPPDAPEGTVPMAVDWYIDTASGQCVVRLVHSGWSADAGWDEQHDATLEGWRYFLFNLRHYLERHPYTPRALIFERRPSPVPRAELWTRLLGPTAVHAGDQIPLRPAEGRELTLLVERAGPSNLWGSIAALDDALLMVELEPGHEQYHCGIYLSVYGLPAAEVDALRPWIGSVADRAITPSGGASPALRRDSRA